MRKSKFSIGQKVVFVKGSHIPFGIYTFTVSEVHKSLFWTTYDILCIDDGGNKIMITKVAERMLGSGDCYGK